MSLFTDTLKQFLDAFPEPPELDVWDVLIDEEIGELLEALGDVDRVAQIKESLDVIWVIVGRMVALGLPFDDLWRELARSNMSKFQGAQYRDDGKLLKGPHYSPANIAGVLGIDREAAL